MLKTGQELENKEEILLRKEYPDLVNHSSIFRQILLPLEMFLLGITLSKQQPYSTREYYTTTMFSIMASKNKIEVIGPMDKNGKNISTKALREVETSMRKQKKSFPSYLKIQHTLERLEHWGIITKRKEYKKSKKLVAFYWVINPKFTILFEDKFKDILHLCLSYCPSEIE